MKYFAGRNSSFVPVMIGLLAAIMSAGCGQQAPEPVLQEALSQVAPAQQEQVQQIPPSKIPKASAAQILARPQVPVLCYHQIRDFKPTDSKTAKDYIVPPAAFREQMKMLHDSGYHAILPGQLMDYLQYGKALPSKPILLTFDDADENQYTVALPELNKYGFKASFFIMTVVLDRPRYMSRAQVKALSDAGHVIGSHTWDHHNVKKYVGDDWVKQIDKPSKELERITGKRMEYFAYPFGLWNKEAIPELKKRGFVAAFQLTAKRDEQEPLYTIRRMIVPGTWSLNTMRNWMRQSF